MSILHSLFHPAVAHWFSTTFKEPTPPQREAWPLIAKKRDVLIQAPTGSGKTLTAFLYALDWLYQREEEKRSNSSVQILYISPLKALNNDIYHNLEHPLQGIEETALEMGYRLPSITRGIRTGDTPPSQRQRMLKRPPQILITTPESLFLLLSSKASQILKDIRFLIIDEIHALFPNKRGAHLSLSLARLQHLVGDRPIQRIGLSATIAPLEEVASFLGNRGESVEIVRTKPRDSLDLKILLPVESFISLEEKTVWPSIYRLLLSLIEGAGTTLVFVNNRRLAERITSNLNSLANEEVAMTHHGSISKEVRHGVEGRLKRGERPCIVATSSLELGIDMGFIHQVIQVESPKEVARGLQRVGRGGHLLTLTSIGRIIPKNRSDLLESYVTLKEMREGRIEEVTAPKNPLDVLAQHLVAMPATDDWREEELYRVIKNAYHFSTLTEEDFTSLLYMLSGLYQVKEYIDLKPRLYWDRKNKIVKKNPYGVRLAYLGGGTIPDRGYYRVHLGEGGVFLGELDEEFVYERRIGDRFLLGTSPWQIEEIKRDQVIVSPSRKGEAIVPFWRAEQGGRSFQLGQRIGEFMERVESLFVEESDSSTIIDWLKDEGLLEERGARELYHYLKGGWEALGSLPTHHHLIVEEFFDELGDRRVLLHSPYGYGLHLLLSLLLQEDLKKSLGIEVEALPGDDGIMFYLPRAIEFKGFNWTSLHENLEERFSYLLAGTPLFSITFRHIAQRSLVLPRGDFKKRKPLYLSRLQAHNLLQVVKKYPMFPLIQETFRELLADYFPLKEAKELITAINTREIRISSCQSSKPSPFAATHLFHFVAAFMYREESPKNEGDLFGIKPSRIKKMLGEEDYRALFLDDVIREVTKRARGEKIERIDKDTILYLIERMGDILLEDLPLLFPHKEREVEGILSNFLEEGQLIHITMGDKTLLTTPERRSLYLDTLQEGTISTIILQYAKTHGPFTIQELKNRYGFNEELLKEELLLFTEEGTLIEGFFSPGREVREWCHKQLLKEIHQKSLARRRRAIETKSRREYSLFLLDWHGIGRTESVEKVLDRLKYLLLPAHLWEVGILPSRVSSYTPKDLDLIISSGLYYWQAKGGSTSFYLSFSPRLPSEEMVSNSQDQYREEVEREALPLSKGALQVKEVLTEKGALSLPQLLIELKISTPLLWEYIEELLLSGLITNDTLGPVRYLLSTSPKERKKNVLSSLLLSTMGRWSLLEESTYMNLFSKSKILLHRHGLISYPLVKREGEDFREYYPIFKELEAIGEIERGYFIEDLGGIQYALPEVRESLSEVSKKTQPLYYTLSSWDPANPLSLFKDEKERKGDWVVFKKGLPLLVASGVQLTIRPMPSLERRDLKEVLLHLLKTLSFLYQGKKMVIKKIHGRESILPWIESTLDELGFEENDGKYTLWPSTRNRLFVKKD